MSATTSSRVHRVQRRGRLSSWMNAAIWTMLVALTACSSGSSSPPGQSSSSSTSGGGNVLAGSPAPTATAAVACDKAYLDSLPVPVRKPELKRVLQMVNCSDQTLLGAANAAKALNQPLTSVFPREGTWVMEPLNEATKTNFKNILTIDVPPEWENTKCPPHTDCPGVVGPRLWARTGCRYDIAADRAQCETGGCGGKYDCSKAKLAATVGVSVAEWTLAEPVESGTKKVKYLQDAPDISIVDGANLNMDIVNLGGSKSSPFDVEGGHVINWLDEQKPLTKYGVDLRQDNRCPANFRLRRSMLTNGKPYGFVIVDANGQPEGGDSTVACFSNCGRHAFPSPPPKDCDPSDKTSQCYLWKSFCLGDERLYQPTFTARCTVANEKQVCPVNGGCWDQKDDSSFANLRCNGRGFIKNQTCSQDVCTYQYGYVDPKTLTKFWSTQPPYGHCSDVTSDATQCIGDDTVHEVFPKAYTWPNDPQVYLGDAEAYRVIFSPGGVPADAPITPAGQIPLCESLPTHYDYSKWKDLCKNDIDAGAVFAKAYPNSRVPPNWGCNLLDGDNGDDAVICRWKAAQ